MLSAKPWRVEVVVWFCAAQLVSLCVGLTLIGVLQKAGFAAFQPPAGAGAVLLGTLAFQGATWVLIFIFLRLHQVNWRDAFGLHRTALNRAWLPAVPVVILFLPPVVLLLHSAFVYVFTRIGWQPQAETAVTVVMSAKAWWLRVYLGVFTVAIAPVAEEFIFRGMLYPFIKQSGWPRLAWLGRQFSVRPDSLGCDGVCAAVPAGAGADVALRKDRQPARAHHGACLVQRGEPRPALSLSK